MTSDEIRAKIKDIITNHIRSSEDPEALELVKSDLHDVLTAKMREKVLGKSEEEPEAEEAEEAEEYIDIDDETE